MPDPKITVVVAGGEVDSGGRDPTAANNVEFRVVSDWGQVTCSLGHQGGHIMFLSSGDLLAEGATERLLAELSEYPDVGFAYADHDTLTSTGDRADPCLKPGWSPDRFQTQMYPGRASLFRADLVVEHFEHAVVEGVLRLHDLALRVVESSPEVLHIPRIIMHEGPGSPLISVGANVAAVDEHLGRHGIQATASSRGGHVVLNPAPSGLPLVTIVTPTAGSSRVVRGEGLCLVERMMSSIHDRTTYPNLELCVVLDQNAPADLEQRLHRSSQEREDALPLKIVRNERDFNFAEACNLGAAHANGEVLIFLNDDTEVISGDWIERLVMRVLSPGVGAAGARLLFSDGRLQHVGLWVRGGRVGHRYVGMSNEFPGAFEALRGSQTCAAVTGACLAITMESFKAVGGFSPQFPLNYNDVDLCLKLAQIGRRTIVDNDTVLFHHELSTRRPTVERWETDRFAERWEWMLHDHPLDSPHFPELWVEEFPAPTVALLEPTTKTVS